MRYVSNKVISFSIRVKGAEDSVRVNFEACASGGSSYSTQVPRVIEALEKSDMYGRVYRRAPECLCECAKPKHKGRRPPKEEKRIQLITSVATWQDAVEYLTEQCGVDEAKLTSPEAIQMEAAKAGVKFPNIG